MKFYFLLGILFLAGCFDATDNDDLLLDKKDIRFFVDQITPVFDDDSHVKISYEVLNEEFLTLEFSTELRFEVDGLKFVETGESMVVPEFIESNASELLLSGKKADMNLIKSKLEFRDSLYRNAIELNILDRGKYLIERSSLITDSVSYMWGDNKVAVLTFQIVNEEVSLNDIIQIEFKTTRGKFLSSNASTIIRPIEENFARALLQLDSLSGSFDIIGTFKYNDRDYAIYGTINVVL